MRHLFLPCLATLYLTACASADGVQYAEHRKLSDKQSQIIVYREDGLLAAPAPTVSVNGQERCKLPAGGYFTIDAKPFQSVRLKLKRLGDIWPSEATVTTQPGLRQFYRVDFNTGGMIAHSVGGLVGGSAVSQRGSFVFADGVDAEAAETKEATNCRGEN
ncbi:MAG: hypothetical protein DI582_09520 [Azospirillum brasilense]|nr:MAG: hypothetical protein DI582_09520 [Azospirillum brasilense]